MSIQNLLITLLKVFFVGLIFQFFAHTFVTYQLGFDSSAMQIIRLRKEILLVVLFATIVVLIIARSQRKLLVHNGHLINLKALFLITILATVALNYLIHQLPRSVYGMAFKYDFFGFFIFFIGFHTSHFIESEQRKKLIQRYGSVVKICLVGALFLYFIVFIKPGTMKLFGFNNLVYEGVVGSQPPAIYYTHINQGLPRSQFLFERPISRGFFLIAFWPFFYLSFLKGKRWQNTRVRRIIYALNVIFTFSRAAWGARFGELILLGLITTRSLKQIKQFALYTLLPLFLFVGRVSWQWYYDIFARQYSNTGHVVEVLKGIEMVKEKPITGHGPASAGPASHRNGEGYNPENQFLQILIEFGLVGFLPRMAIYLYLSLIGIISRRQVIGSTQKNKDINRSGTPPQMLLACSLGLVGLAAEGMLLHSFTDRMIVYPFMMLFGIVFYMWSENRKTDQ